jgi:hypothetical protein
MQSSCGRKVFNSLQIGALLGSFGLLAVERFWMRELAAGPFAFLGFLFSGATIFVGIVGLVYWRCRKVYPLLTFLLSLWFLVMLLVHLSRYR